MFSVVIAKILYGIFVEIRVGNHTGLLIRVSAWVRVECHKLLRVLGVM